MRLSAGFFAVMVLSVILICFAFKGKAVAVPPEKPNIIVIMADDLSKDLFDALVNGGWMPNLKTHIVDNGVEFDNSFVTNALCCPSRATFLTGLYSHNHRVFSNKSSQPLSPGITSPGWFPTENTPGKNESTIATWLKEAGYHTGFIGKYLNGYGNHAPYNVENPKTYIPPGWDDWQGLIDPSTYRVYNYFLNDNGTVVAYGESETDYQTDVIADRAVQFIEERSNPENPPFFLLVTPLAPHIEVLDVTQLLYDSNLYGTFDAAIRPAPRHDYLVEGEPQNVELPPLIMKPSFNETDVSDKPTCPAPLPSAGYSYNPDPFCIGDRPELRDGIDVENIEFQFKTMAASMLAVDDMIGRIMDVLLAEGVYNNTVVIFTSDNGWFYGEHRTSGKELAYEESIRVPLVIRAPSYAADVNASQIVLNNDLAPTLADLAGITPAHEPDGTSLVPILEAPGRMDWHRKSFLIEHWFIPSLSKFQYPTYFAVRHIDSNRDYLYVETYADQSDLSQITHHEFYDIDIDPYQLSSFTLQEVIKDMFHNYLLQFRSCRGADCLTKESF